MTTLVIFLVLVAVLFLLRETYSKYCLKDVDVKLMISSITATEGDKLILSEVVTNAKWLPLPWLTVRFQVDRGLAFNDQTDHIASDFYYRNDLFHVLMHQKIKRHLHFTCTRRGVYGMHDLEVTAWDFLMTEKHMRKYDFSTRITVFPSTLDDAETEELCTRIYGQLRTRYPIHPDPFSFRGIREYSTSDPMKNINFKASAKTHELMVNIRDFGGTRQVVLLLDMERHIIGYNEMLEERAIRIVATLAEHLTSQGIPIAYVTNGSSIAEGCGVHHLHTILEALAHINISAKEIEPFEKVLDRIALEKQFEPEYLLISPYYNKSIDTAFSQLYERGARTAWVMPEPKPHGQVYADRIIFI